MKFLRLDAQDRSEKQRDSRTILRGRSSSEKIGAKKEAREPQRNSSTQPPRPPLPSPPCKGAARKAGNDEIIKLESPWRPVVKEMGDHRQSTCWRRIKRPIDAAVPVAIAKRNVTRGGLRLRFVKHDLIPRDLIAYADRIAYIFARPRSRADEKSSDEKSSGRNLRKLARFVDRVGRDRQCSNCWKARYNHEDTSSTLAE